MQRLFLVTHQGHTEIIELASGPVTLGRATDNDLSFPEDSGLSRHHLVFQERGGRWIVEDLGSRNGTLVNGERIDTRVLKDGDEIQVGQTHFVFHEK